MLGARVDLSPAEGLREPVAAKASREAIDLEAFRQEPKTVAAVERKLLLISEAAVRLTTCI